MAGIFRVFALYLAATCLAHAAPKSQALNCGDAFAEARVTGKPVPKVCERASRTSGKVGESGACASLSSDYEDASKQLARSYADGLTDNSAIRATMRETQNGTVIERAKMTMDLMKANNCRLPTSAPDFRRYLTAALDCKKAELDQTLARQAQGYRSWDITNMPPPPAECRIADWKPSTGN